MALLWQAKSLKDFSRLELVRSAQAQDFGNGAFRAEVRFGDVFPGYTEQRSLWDVSQHLFHEGGESWFGLSVMLPADWIGWFPKNDELGNWPGNHDALKGGMHGGSFFEWHHGPENGDWGDPNLGGSAPLYVVATDTAIKLYLVDPVVGPRPDAIWNVVPSLERQRFYDLVIGALWSTDPKKGWVEAYADGKQVAPRFLTSTLYPLPRPPTFVYAQAGIYRRDFIGNPTLTWPADAKPGVSYPPLYVPKKGAKVFQDGGGLPQSVQLKNLRLGTAKEDVMTLPTDTGKADAGATTAASAPPTPAAAAATPTNFDATKPSVNPNDGAAQLMATRDALQVQVAAINAVLSKGAYKPAG
ncbi:MAG TPA: hypothetical protein VGI97_00695 [Gemmatimonadaceae bacterium]|jgi:hypothetical protein